MVIIMLGAPASGKGSVAELLAAEFKIPAISSGDIFRKNISEGTELGKKANEYMTKGLLVPDDVTVELIASRLLEDDVKDGLILDGFPRTVVQAEKLDKMLESLNKKIDIVVNLETPEEEILERVVNRRICTNSACKTVYNTVLNPSQVEGICDKCGSDAVLEAMELIECGKACPVKQNDDEATHAAKITKEECLVEFDMNAIAAYNKIRGLSPVPCAYIVLNDKRIKIVECELSCDEGEPGKVLCADKNGIKIAFVGGSITLKRIRPEGSGEMTAWAYVLGHEAEFR